MSTVAASRRGNAPPGRSPDWRERAGRLYLQLRRPAQAMIRRAFRGAFGDDEIEDIYSNAWLGTLRALERRHDELSDEEVRKYVLTAVANHASKELRRRNRRPTAPLDAIHAIPDGRASPDERAAKLEASRIARDLLATLPPRRRAVMLLRYGWGLEPRQVCRLVKGLSPRAYRKEITRGVDELTEKLHLLERGEWCADREPVLKAYAAGLADAEQQRQARQHLSHCRPCAEFVGKLSGHLHDIGSSLATVGWVDTIGDGRLSLPDRAGDVIHRVSESAGNALGGRSGVGAEDVVTRVASLPGGARGVGAAGTGVLAKLAGLGTAGKLVAVCLGGSAAATACLVTAMGPADPRGGETRTAHNRPAVERRVSASPGTPVGIFPSQPGDDAAQSPPPASGEEPADDGAFVPPPASEPEPTPPIAPSAPPAQQEFGVASAASGADNSGAPSSSGGGAPAVQREFGP
jgi:RNA polymerase sigma factor (sigma-70 family)